MGDAVHRVGCPVEQIGEKVVDGFAPKEEPPEDAAQHQEINERKDSKVADDGEKWNTPKVDGNEWCCEDGAEQGDGNRTP